MLCYIKLCCTPSGSVRMCVFLESMSILWETESWSCLSSTDIWHPVQHCTIWLCLLSPETGPPQEVKKKNNREQLQGQTDPHKSNMNLKGNLPLFPLLWLFELSLLNTQHILLIPLSIATEIFNHPFNPLMWIEQPPKAQRGMTEMMKCGSFCRKFLVVEVLRQQCSLWSRVLMSPSDCWVENHKRDFNRLTDKNKCVSLLIWAMDTHYLYSSELRGTSV